MGHTMVKVAAPALAALGALGMAGTALAGAAGASAKPKAATFSLRGEVANVEATAGRFELKVGTRDVVVSAKRAELAALKVGDEVWARGDIVRNVRTAQAVTSLATSATAAKAKTKAKTPVAKAGADTFDLRGVVVRTIAKEDRFELKVGTRDVVVGVKAAELATLKAGETVAVRGTIVHNVRMAAVLEKA